MIFSMTAFSSFTFYVQSGLILKRSFRPYLTLYLKKDKTKGNGKVLRSDLEREDLTNGNTNTLTGNFSEDQEVAHQKELVLFVVQYSGILCIAPGRSFIFWNNQLGLRREDFSVGGVDIEVLLLPPVPLVAPLDVREKQLETCIWNRRHCSPGLVAEVVVWELLVRFGVGGRENVDPVVLRRDISG